MRKGTARLSVSGSGGRWSELKWYLVTQQSNISCRIFNYFKYNKSFSYWILYFRALTYSSELKWISSFQHNSIINPIETSGWYFMTGFLWHSNTIELLIKPFRLWRQRLIGGPLSPDPLWLQHTWLLQINLNILLLVSPSAAVLDALVNLAPSAGLVSVWVLHLLHIVSRKHPFPSPQPTEPPTGRICRKYKEDEWVWMRDGKSLLV